MTIRTNHVIDTLTTTTNTLVVSATGALTLPSGATEDRPSATNGMIRYNTTDNKFEMYENGTWVNMSGVSEPANQIVYGTGSGVDSSSTFTYNTTSGALSFAPSSNSSPGAVSISAATKSSSGGTGAAVSITAGSTSGGSDAVGGAISITAGAGSTAGDGGAITIQAGTAGSSGSGVGGAGNLFGGDATGATSTGGFVLVRGGEGGLSGGQTLLRGGQATNTTTGTGGDVGITGGTGGNGAIGGNVVVTGGTTSNGAGTAGTIQFRTGLTPTQRFIIDASGALGIGTGPSYGTSGQVLTSNGSGSAPTWQSVSASEANAITFNMTNGHGSTISKGDVVYVSAAGTVGLGDADATATSTPVIGVVFDTTIDSSLSGKICSHGKVTGLTGLTAGATYYLSQTPGQPTSTAPSASGTWVVPIGIALSTTELLVNVGTPIQN